LAFILRQGYGRQAGRVDLTGSSARLTNPFLPLMGFANGETLPHPFD
jgi:hypothetical protein